MGSGPRATVDVLSFFDDFDEKPYLPGRPSASTIQRLWVRIPSTTFLVYIPEKYTTFVIGL